MSKVVGEKIAQANVGAIVQSLLDNDNKTEVRVTAVPGAPGFFRIEAD
jgi:hypothetical protein